MSNSAPFDRDDFQKILADAFAVQQSQMDTQSLSAFVETQRLIAFGDLDADEAMHRIAGCTRMVADATGVAIGLLHGHELVYRAGSGSAADFVGRHLIAALNVSADTGTIREILRVEDAQDDPRIGAAICRQFLSKSLLMLLVQHDRRVQGVLQILFAEPHTFQEHEVRTYRLMAGLIHEVMAKTTQIETKRPLPPDLLPVRRAVPSASPMSELPAMDDVVPEVSNDVVSPVGTAAITVAEALPVLLRTATQGMKGFHGTRRNLAVAAVVAAATLAGWFAYRDHRPALSRASSTQQGSNSVAPPHEVVLPVKPVPAAWSEAQAAPSLTGASTKPGSGFRRVRAGKHEVDYVADDVTVRYFTQNQALQQASGKYRQLEVGNDVTVRYFALRPASLSGPQPIATATKPVDPSLPPEKSKIAQ